MNISADWLQNHFPLFRSPTLIGKGGQKVVFAGVHDNHGPSVLKIINPQQDFAQVEREIIAVKTLKSNRVPRIHEYGVTASDLGDCVWIVEQHIHGESVRRCIDSHSLNPLAVLALGKDVLQVLSEAESQRIVHRDIKPENLIRSSDAFYTIDFGLSRHLDLNSITATAAPYGKGTLGYAPPEQITNDKGQIDTRADLFSLGVTLYECSVGTNPLTYCARDALEVFTRTSQIDVPRVKLPIVEEDLFADLVQALTQRRRDRRPHCARFALEWIDDVIRGQAKISSSST